MGETIPQSEQLQVEVCVLKAGRTCEAPHGVPLQDRRVSGVLLVQLHHKAGRFLVRYMMPSVSDLERVMPRALLGHICEHAHIWSFRNIRAEKCQQLQGKDVTGVKSS